MSLLDEIIQYTTTRERTHTLSGDISKLHYSIKEDASSKKLIFYTYNWNHRCSCTACIWIIILFVIMITLYEGIIWLSIPISLFLILLAFTPHNCWVLDFYSDSIWKVLKIFWIPVSKKEFSKKRFYGTRLKIRVVFFYYVPVDELEYELETVMEKYYKHIEPMESDANKAIDKSHHGDVSISVELVPRGEENPIRTSLPSGRFGYLKTKRLKRKIENPFLAMMQTFFTEKRIRFLRILTDFFSLSSHFLTSDSGPKTYNSLSVSLVKTYRSYGSDVD